MKIVVFDLDETLGYFTQFGIFWDSLCNYVKIKNKTSLSQDDFNKLLDLYPEFLRPNIINILNYLKNKKKTQICNKIMIYTNNTGSREWLNHIISYFEKKIKFKLMDKIIAAFKVNGKHIELCRTTQNKTHKDLIKCSKIPLDTEICFIDDIFHPEMVNDNTYYINIKPYYHDLSFEEIINRFEKSDLGMKLIENKSEFKNITMEHIVLFNYMIIEKDKKEYEIDEIVGKYIIFHLQKFFNHSLRNRTIRNRNYKKNKTLKNINML
jgi:hypothetical protein